MERGAREHQGVAGSAAAPSDASRLMSRGHLPVSDAEAAIYRATEELLESHSLTDLSVAQIIRHAGVSRATFYHYFGSKLGVVAGLLARIMDDVHGRWSPFLRQPGAAGTRASLRISLDAAVAVWAAHRTVLQVVMSNWASDAELEAQWCGAMGRFADVVAAEIDAERRAGRLDLGVESRALAAALVWSTERCLYIAGRGSDRALSDETVVVEPLVAVWAAALDLCEPGELPAQVA